MLEKKLLKFTPLTEATYYILLAFSTPLHGYGVIKKVEKKTNGRLKLAAGTLYGVVSSLLNSKLITLVSEDTDNKKKKEYQITEIGKQLLNYEIGRLSEMVENGRKVV
jgi:DNA-binding PadR family transcriptional regulator